MVTTVHIADMHAVHAIRGVFTALSAVEGIVTADVRMGVAVVEHDGRVTGEALRSALEAAGYRVTAVEEDRRRLHLAPEED